MLTVRYSLWKKRTMPPWISARDVDKVFDPNEEPGQAKRNVRYLQHHLLMHYDHNPVLSKAGSGER
jgi:hypothetical protein